MMKQQVNQQQHWQQQQQPPAETPAQAALSLAKEKQQQNARGLQNIDVFAGAQEHWLNWMWKVRTAESGMYSDLAEVMKAAEAKSSWWKWAKRSARKPELSSVLARYTGSEAARIVRVTGLNGVEARNTLHASYSRMSERIFREQREYTQRSRKTCKR